MVQALTFSQGRVRYRTRYVRTNKYLEEQRAGHYLYPTFSTHGSGPLRLNLGLTLANQANTTVLAWADRVWAFDESQRPYQLTTDLETVGERPVDDRQQALRYWAHWKLDAANRQVHVLAIDQVPVAKAHVVSLSEDGTVVARRHIRLPRTVYFHDWFVSEHFFAFLLHPAFISLGKLLQVLLGRETFSEAVQWRPSQGSVLLVVDRQRDRMQTLTAKPCWMWHAINAFEANGQLICDFVGNELGGNLGTASSPLFKIMSVDPVHVPKQPRSWLRRYRIDLVKGALDEIVLDATANFELPGISATERTGPYTKAYLIQAHPGDVFARSLCQLDGQSLSTRTYSFQPGEFCSEPVFLDTVFGARGRHLISQVYDSREKRSYFALFDEERFEQGPIARIALEHHVPLSFHGYWSGIASKTG
jgi:all-trans-8'-apo-beta-carotenal 15,15'-oxygenase